MQVIYLDIHHIPSLPPLALSIGNFDGVHLGHQAMIAQLIHIASHHNLATAVMVFEPQPKELFDPQHAPARLSTLKEKLSHFNKMGIQFVLVARFDDTFRHLNAQQFANILQQLNVQSLMLGDDFRFGANRVGSAHFLVQQGFDVQILNDVHHNNQRISSTKVRNHLASGDLKHANALLGYPYHIIGEVIYGNQLGRTLGFPTANIALNRIKPAVMGVYAVRVNGISTQLMGGLISQDGIFGCANIGIRPSVDLGNEWRCEIFLPNFTGDLYHQTLKVTFLHFLHDEKKYNSLDELQKAIQTDVKTLINWYHANLNQ